jgi:hypothetical protein
MPIEIRELVIKVTITPDNQQPVVAGDISLEKIKKQIIRECVDQVIIKLDKRAER